MKIFFILLFVSHISEASKPKPLSLQFSLNCVTEYPTTSFISHLSSTKIKFQIRNHNGHQLMPFFSGIITPNDLPLLNKKAESLKPMGNESWITFDIADCVSYSDKSFSCYGDNNIQVDNKDIALKGKGLSLSFINSYVMDQVTQEVQVSARIGDKDSTSGDLEITMRYSKNECRVQL